MKDSRATLLVLSGFSSPKKVKHCPETYHLRYTFFDLGDYKKNAKIVRKQAKSIIKHCKKQHKYKMIISSYPDSLLGPSIVVNAVDIKEYEAFKKTLNQSNANLY